MDPQAEWLFWGHQKLLDTSVMKLKHLEEKNSQTFLETAMPASFTLLMLHSAFFPVKPGKPTADRFVICFVLK